MHPHQAQLRNIVSHSKSHESSEIHHSRLSKTSLRTLPTSQSHPIFEKMHIFGKRKFNLTRKSKARCIFLAATTLVILAVSFLLISSISHSHVPQKQYVAFTLFYNSKLYSKPFIVKFRRGSRSRIAFPDSRTPLDPSLKGKAWQLANKRQVVSHAVPQEEQTTAQSVSTTSNYGRSICSPLCGRHGWGKCINGTKCLCPVFYDGMECMKGIELPKSGPLRKLEAKYVGDLTMNRLSLEGKKWVVGFIPEKLQGPDNGSLVLGAVTRDILKTFPVRDPLAAGKVYGRCAIVGSSGISLHYSHGEEISQHDLVMRFNSAPRQGYEQYVGNKTTVRVTNAVNWGFFEHPSEMVLVPLRTPGALNALVKVRERFPRMRLLGISPDFLRYVASSFDFVPSIGLLGIFIALQRCNQVNLYGFHAYREQNVRYHYFNPCAQPMDENRDKQEYTVLNRLTKLGLLNWGDPCIQICHNRRTKCATCLARNRYQVLETTSPPIKCPSCSFAREGCKRNRHWAFRTIRAWPRVRLQNSSSDIASEADGGDDGQSDSTDIDGLPEALVVSGNNSTEDAKAEGDTQAGGDGEDETVETVETVEGKLKGEGETEDGVGVDDESVEGKAKGEGESEDGASGEDEAVEEKTKGEGETEDPGSGEEDATDEKTKETEDGEGGEEETTDETTKAEGETERGGGGEEDASEVKAKADGETDDGGNGDEETTDEKTKEEGETEDGGGGEEEATEEKTKSEGDGEEETTDGKTKTEGGTEDGGSADDEASEEKTSGSEEDSNSGDGGTDSDGAQ